MSASIMQALLWNCAVKLQKWQMSVGLVSLRKGSIQFSIYIWEWGDNVNACLSIFKEFITPPCLLSCYIQDKYGIYQLYTCY